ncbi:BamA/TamA family outer membrane protein [Gelidibacter mesophilus]|uniref:BamA/TamA family outer membrane protein n=1 Tax=Gelidibacter mesophilus TaxID=169050 RepID=UPI000426DCA7|nr:BamA/TamA family outer membrane protein [Gelidibacter mesophilus]
MLRSKVCILLGLFFSVCLFFESYAQESKTHSILKDTLDGKLDLSRFANQASGFIPVFFIITEPALGGVGIGAAPLFIDAKPENDSGEYLPPDVTSLYGIYTGNNTWGVGAARIGSFTKQKIKYRVSGGYTSINLSLYRNIPLLGEREFEFNFKTAYFYTAISKELGKTGLYAGLDYLFLNTKVSPNFEREMPEFVSEKEINSKTSSLGVFLEIDKRNSVFTPDYGFYAKLDFGINADWTGSDYKYERLDAKGSWFYAIKPNWISGLRLEVQQIFDTPPFYLLPGIDLRGVPSARYQGHTTMLLATEQRYDFTRRWSGVAFGGVGKAIQRNQSFKDADLAYGVGGGFRYLLARTLNFRSGIDVAYGPEGWAYYFVFGHAWNR